MFFQNLRKKINEKDAKLIAAKIEFTDILDYSTKRKDEFERLESKGIAKIQEYENPNNKPQLFMTLDTFNVISKPITSVCEHIENIFNCIE